MKKIYIIEHSCVSINTYNFTDEWICNYERNPYDDGYFKPKNLLWMTDISRGQDDTTLGRFFTSHKHCVKILKEQIELTTKDKPNLVVSRNRTEIRILSSRSGIETIYRIVCLTKANESD